MSLAGHLYSVNPTWPRGLMWTAAGLTALPVERLHRIDAGEPVTKALDTIVQEDVNQLPVLEGGQIRGVISREQILRLVVARAELRM
jgi:signal-transduction protein with cAMP-binding, CBS, and nucleotidyltransferase domain